MKSATKGRVISFFRAAQGASPGNAASTTSEDAASTSALTLPKEVDSVSVSYYEHYMTVGDAAKGLQFTFWFDWTFPKLFGYTKSVQSSITNGLKYALAQAAGYFSSVFTNKMNITIDVGYGEIAKQRMFSGDLGESVEDLYKLADGYCGTPAELIALRKSSDLESSDQRVQGYIGLGTGIAWDFANHTPNSAQYCAIGTLGHEISEVMGRQSGVGQTFADGTKYSTFMDRYRYKNAIYSNASHTGGHLVYCNGDAKLGDTGDWSPIDGYDAFDYASPSGAPGWVTKEDLHVMHLLGYNLTANAVSNDLYSFWKSPGVPN